MYSWQTTTAGILSALGTAMMGATYSPDFHWLATVGQVLSATGTLWLGAAARDNNKSSEDVGVQ